MSKIAIISQPDKGVLIDVGGCDSLKEATHHLTSTLKISSEFWKDTNVELNLGSLSLSEDEVAQVIAIAKEVGVNPRQVFSMNTTTQAALKEHNITIGTGAPMCLPTNGLDEADHVQVHSPSEKETTASSSPSSENKIEAPQHPVKLHFHPEDAVERQTTKELTGDKLSLVLDPTETKSPLSVLYLRQTLRSGQAVSHKGHLVIIGDVNPGAEVIAEGDITVWGALRGIAHAGINGNTQAEIRALRLQPIQIRIAHAIARSPDRPLRSNSSHKGPETARIVGSTIRIIANNPD